MTTKTDEVTPKQPSNEHPPMSLQIALKVIFSVASLLVVTVIVTLLFECIISNDANSPL